MADRSKLKSKLQRICEKSRFTTKLYQFAIYAKRRHDAGKYIHLPIDDNLIVFECYKGKKYTCSPKALYEALMADEQFKDYKCVWVFNKPSNYSYLKNKRTTLCGRNSKTHIKSCMTAKYRITNSTNDKYLPVREGQIYFQCWHGTPLKRLGNDIKVKGNEAQSLREIHKSYTREKKTLTYLLSPSDYCNECFSTAFGMTEEEKKSKIIQNGYPRNDFLFKYTQEDILRIKKKLKLPLDKKVILYAPTFRETGYHLGRGFSNDLYLDLAELKEKLSDEYVVLIRTHYLAKVDFSAKEFGGFLYKVNNIDEINELYVISDMLVTDYSSVFYDYSVLSRPMIMYMPDFDNYKGNLRDFYMDIEDIPAKKVYTQSDLEDYILSLSGNVELDEEERIAFRKFNEKFHPYDNADSAHELLLKILK
ncbi:MAG: CDP-glycerol glycerophosphotransferase family protein [Lachnospiraceae bacterium]|nr:CDP-glycerol glycerophosphotransferase family protein [Lachnospiraceae bacterium]